MVYNKNLWKQIIETGSKFEKGEINKFDLNSRGGF